MAGGSVDGVTRRGVGSHVQGPHRRPARLAVARDHRAGCRRAGRTVQAYDPRRSAGSTDAPRARGHRGRRRPVRRVRGRRGAASCSPSGTSSGGSTSTRSPRRWPRRAIVDARNLLDRAALRRRGFELPGHRARPDGAGRRHRRRRLPRLAPLRGAARPRRRGRRPSTTSSPASVDNIEHLFGAAGLHVRATTT